MDAGGIYTPDTATVDTMKTGRFPPPVYGFAVVSGDVDLLGDCKLIEGRLCQLEATEGILNK